MPDWMHTWLTCAPRQLRWPRLNLPSRCAICGHWPTHGPLCDTCIAKFAQPRLRCNRCALPMTAAAPCCGACLRQPPPLHRTVAAVDYGWPWRSVVARFKFQDATGWAEHLAWLMRSAAGAEELLQQADWVLPVPVSAQRLAERGYNQAGLLARHLAPRTHDLGLLLRIRHTAAQYTLPRAQRWTQLQGAFAPEPTRAHLLQGKSVLLIDDVMTSGASLHTAAHVLHQAGVRRVSALVLARTESDNSDRPTP